MSGRTVRRPAVSRASVVLRVQGELAQGFPRVQMFLLVALTGGFGLLASFCMLKLGLESMALRYPLALTAAYLFFLMLLWLWLRTRGDDYANVPDLAPNLSSSDPSCGPAFGSGDGGSFAGGGASGSYEGSTGAWVERGGDLGGIEQNGVVSEAASAIGEADELAIPLAVVVLTIGLAVATLYVVYIAPVLFAELLVDGALSYVLFRRLRREERRFWLHSAVRHTWLPFVLTGIFLMAAGAVLSAYAPDARSIGQVIDHARSR